MRFWFSRNPNKEAPSAIDKDGSSPSTSFDVEKWRNVINHDKAIGAIAENLRPLGDKWVNEFARSYLSLNDKKQTWRVVQRVIEEARQERKRADI